MYKFLLSPLLFCLPPERAHAWVLGVMSLLCRVALVRKIMRARFAPSPCLTKFANLTLPNPIGLAAGFDKDARFLLVWHALGFGFVEIGTLTPKSQSGHPKPRLFRLKKDKALLNRMGFNNQGIQVALKRLQRRPKGLIVGANIGKNKDSADATADYLFCLKALYPYVDYFTLNVSSPNTEGLRRLQAPEALEALIRPLVDFRATQKAQRPILLKLAPDLSPKEVKMIASLLKRLGIEGLIIGNTTLDRTVLRDATQKRLRNQKGGGISGAPLCAKALALLNTFDKREKTLIRIGVGGIMGPQEARRYKATGCTAIQIYTGLIYEGPHLLKQLSCAWK